MTEIVQLLASPVHRYEGRPGDGPAPEPPGELVTEIRLRAGLGIVGDRYFGKESHREAAVTVVALESLPPGADLRQVRRNILVGGIAVDDLVGSVFVLDSGDGPVRLRATRPANPCAWMDATIGPGARDALRGKGGVRCVPLDDGILRVGPVKVVVTAKVLEVLREAGALLARPENDYSRSSFANAETALAEIDTSAARVQADGEVPSTLKVLFAPTGPIQEVSLSSGWGDEFVTLAHRFDTATGEA